MSIFSKKVTPLPSIEEERKMQREREQKLREQEESKQKSLGEWVWIEGYKGTDENMKCRGFQFELNKQYNIEGDVYLCHNGFHFCKNLKEVFPYYDLIHGNRYFKVKALVNMELIKEQRYELFRKSFHYNDDEKLVAKSIIFTEEVTLDKLFPYIKERYDFIETENDWEKAKRIGYPLYLRNYFIRKMKDFGLGDAFLNILYDKKINNESSKAKSLMNYTKALKEENVSKDMMVYLLLNK